MNIARYFLDDLQSTAKNARRGAPTRIRILIGSDSKNHWAFNQVRVNNHTQTGRMREKTQEKSYINENTDRTTTGHRNRINSFPKLVIVLRPTRHNAQQFILTVWLKEAASASLSYLLGYPLAKRKIFYFHSDSDGLLFSSANNASVVVILFCLLFVFTFQEFSCGDLLVQLFIVAMTSWAGILFHFMLVYEYISFFQLLLPSTGLFRPATTFIPFRTV